MTDKYLLDQRIKRLVEALRAADIECAALVPGPSFYYLTGIQLHLMERPTVLFVSADGRLHGVIPGLEKGRWQADMPQADTEYWQDSDGPESAFARIASRLNTKQLGVEGQRMRVFEGNILRRHFGEHAVLDAQTEISAIRLFKDGGEIACQEKAVAISEAALKSVTDQVQVGMSERRIQQLLQMAMLENGAEGFGFEAIVLSGGMSADPHGVASADRTLQPGDPLLFDFGGMYGGYSADITRTFFCQKVSQEHRDIYETVRLANGWGRDNARAGMTAHDLDAGVTKVLRDSPFSHLIVHKTGHGLGLDIHEMPQIMSGSDAVLQPDMVFTIEPGLYRPADIGVRIEDDVVITGQGCRSLTSFDRALSLIG